MYYYISFFFLLYLTDAHYILNIVITFKEGLLSLGYAYPSLLSFYATSVDVFVFHQKLRSYKNGTSLKVLQKKNWRISIKMT